jgi:protein tyrosine/serine phosphatase
MEFNEVLPRVLVGSCPRTTNDIDCLIDEHGVSAVLNLQTDSDLAYWQIDWPQLAQHYRSRGMIVRRVPVVDFNQDDLRDRLPDCVTALTELLRDERKVYVHCNVGVNRSPSVVIAYLHWVRGWALDEALDFMLHRRVCNPLVESIRTAAGFRPSPEDVPDNAPGR